MVKARQITKLEKMKTCNMKIQSHCSTVEAILNINKRQPITPEKTMLNKGLNFATTIKRIPYLDLTAPIEEAALKIPKARADELRWKVRLTLEKSKPPKKARGHIGWNVVEITIKMKTTVRKPLMIKITKLRPRNSDN